jgi:hypothetical protein
MRHTWQRVQSRPVPAHLSLSAAFVSILRRHVRAQTAFDVAELGSRVTVSNYVKSPWYSLTVLLSLYPCLPELLPVVTDAAFLSGLLSLPLTQVSASK